MKVLRFLIKIIRCTATAIWWVFVAAAFIPALLALAVAFWLIMENQILGYISLIPYLFFFVISLLRYKKA